MLKFCKSKRVANAVLAAVDATLQDGEQDGHWVEAFSNGREQGYCIKASNGDAICFSECRNSDSIVVYNGTWRDFSIDNKPENDKTWHGTYFGFGEYQNAAEHITALMNASQPLKI